MRKRKWLINLILGIILLYLGSCIVIYYIQEYLIFNPKKLPSDYHFKFDFDYEEVTIVTADKIKLNGVLVRSDSSKGLIFFLHGTGGNIERYKNSIPVYLELNYDIFLLDYRGYGKSEGKIKNETQFYEDVNVAYTYLNNKYNESNIVIIGFSIGTVPASMLASKNNPSLVILDAPYYSALESAQKKLPFLPVSLILKYKFETYKYVIDTKGPIAIFHGNKDDAVDFRNSLRLKQHLKPGDMVTILDGEGHSDFTTNNQYIKDLKALLK